MTTVLSADLKYLLSAPGASAGFTDSGTPGNSLGRFAAFTELSALFPDLTGAQNAARQVDYGCVFLLNATESGNPMLNTVVWLPVSGDVTGATIHALGADTVPASPRDSSSPQGLLIASATTAPAGVTFVPPSATNAGGVSLGTIPAGSVRAVWLRRTATNSAPKNSDGFVLECTFDTQG